MILLTIGTQLAFNRLIKAMDDIAPFLDQPVFGQIGASTYEPQSFIWSRTLVPSEFEEKFRAASVIVSHAGIGTVLTAQRMRKPIILFPREAGFFEHRNDHQLATCAQLMGRPGIAIARNADELLGALQAGNLVPASEDQLRSKRNDFIAKLTNRLAAIATEK